MVRADHFYRADKQPADRVRFIGRDGSRFPIVDSGGWATLRVGGQAVDLVDEGRDGVDGRFSERAGADAYFAAVALRGVLHLDPSVALGAKSKRR